jgi:hypothetical protein
MALCSQSLNVKKNALARKRLDIPTKIVDTLDKRAYATCIVMGALVKRGKIFLECESSLGVSDEADSHEIRGDAVFPRIESLFLPTVQEKTRPALRDRAHSGCNLHRKNTP